MGQEAIYATYKLSARDPPSGIAVRVQFTPSPARWRARYAFFSNLPWNQPPVKQPAPARTTLGCTCRPSTAQHCTARQMGSSLVAQVPRWVRGCKLKPMTPPTTLARVLEPSQVPAFAAASRLMKSSSHSLSTVYMLLYLGTDSTANQPPKPFASRWIGFAGDSRASFFLSHCALFFLPLPSFTLFSTSSFSHKRDTE